MIDPVKTIEQPVGDGAKPEIPHAENGHQSKFDVVLLSIRRLLKRGAIANLTNLLGRLHPADVARVIVHLDTTQERRTIFELVEGIAEQGQVVSELSKEMIPQVLEDRNAADIAWMLRFVPADDVAYILGVLPEERSQEILPLMKDEESQEVVNLMAYPKGTAGSIMTTEFFSLPEDMTAQVAIKNLQQDTKAETVFYIYVTDQTGKLTGVMSLRELLVVAPTALLKSILARDVISVTVDTDQEEVARQVANYNLLAIPVVADGERLVGIITVDDVVDVIREEDTKDMLKMAGAAEEDAEMHTSSMQAVGLRLPWLFANLVGSLVSGFILWWFRFTIQEVVAIVMFLPVIAAMGGNLGLQSSTLIIRGIATGRVELSDIWKVVFREMRIGLALGLICGTLLLVAGWVWQGNVSLGFVVGSSLLITFLISASMATVTPLMLKKFKIDPAVAAGPFITTAMDITGVTIYLGLATMMLEYLH
ncbi:MAG: magnesium transporter [Nitrospirota bacterium]|nr:magnesium transporter [Nitrospirota bacterium]